MPNVADVKYFEFFYWTVMAGLTCGLDHPIEWIINAWRTPGGTLPPEHYEDCRKHTPRFLVDTFDAMNMRQPKNAQEVLDMCDEHYPKEHMARGFFERARAEIDEYLKQETDDSGDKNLAEVKT